MTDLSEIPGKHGVKNVYADVGQLFAQSTIADPRVSAVMMGQLIKGMGVDHVCWGTDAIWTGSPQWQIEALRRLEIPEDLQKKYGLQPLGPADGPIKTAIFGRNNARLYNYKPEHRAALEHDQLAHYKELYEKHGAGRTNLAYGYALKIRVSGDRRVARPVTLASLRRALHATRCGHVAGAAVAPDVPRAQRATAGLAEVTGTEHWAVKRAGADNVKLFMWRKRLKSPSATSARRGTILFVHGSSVSATPVFDLRIPGKPEASTMDWFARLGYDTWCVDCEGYGHSDKWRPVNADVSCGADDLAAASEYIMAQNGGQPLLLYGASSGRVARGTVRAAPSGSACSGLRSTRWCGPAKAVRRWPSARSGCAQYQASNRRPIDRAFVQSIFTRDHPGTSDLTVVDAFADAVLALDTSMPNGTYIDMSANLPVLDPRKISVPTLIMRGAVRRHRLVPGPRQFLRAAAERRQAVHRHARDRAYQHALEELGARLSPARRQLQPTGPGVRRLSIVSSREGVPRSLSDDAHGEHPVHADAHVVACRDDACGCAHRSACVHAHDRGARRHGGARAHARSLRAGARVRAIRQDGAPRR